MAELERLDVELEPDGGTFHGRPSDGSRSIRNRKELELLLTLFWAPATVFVVAEVVSYLCMHKSFFGNAFDVGISYEQVVEVHVFASIAMWILAAVQIRIETRKRQSPALHRLTGVVMLLLFFLIVFPSSLYLSALQRIEYWAPAVPWRGDDPTMDIQRVAAVLLDTAGCTAFFLCAALWEDARHQWSESLALHGRLMQCGVMMSMAILPQRFLQFYLSMQFRTFPQAGGGMLDMDDCRTKHQVNYSASILVTSVLFFVYGHFFEGPRGRIWVQCIGAEHLEEVRSFSSWHG
ncbi:unnamed protein product [Cladocopium goreaui]|uniref:Uncharacterized protein n=1 Tax=Cladocopium goreaui TaxID=2562237 RepID=A0A9P1FPJ2_9DINO|nr:unnamed protein product [Cladocopium goreaui]